MGEIFRQERSEDALTEAADDRIARLHRYYVARTFCRGRDVLVMDAGDGSGAAVLAQVAGSVVALVGSEAARAAAAAAFPARSLSVRTGEAGGGFDVVVAFEALERADDPAALMARLRCMLRAGGSLLLATDGQEVLSRSGLADGRRRVLDRDGLQRLAAHFAHTALFGQLGLVGSAMIGAAKVGRPAPLVVRHRDLLHADISDGPGPEAALFCVASDTPIELPDSLFIDSDVEALADIQARAVDATARLATLQAERDALAAEAGQTRRSEAQWRHELAVLRVSEAAAVTGQAQGRAASEAERAQYMGVVGAMQAREQQTQGRLDALQIVHAASLDHIDNLQAERDRALARLARLEARLRRFSPRAMLSALMPSMPMLARLGRGNRRVAAVARSPLFDGGWYLARYADVARSGMAPARHYVRHGAAEQRDPGPAMDAAWYAGAHPDLAGSGLSAVEHYERHGRAAGWPTRPPEIAAAEPPATADGAPDEAEADDAPPVNPRVLFISGESDTPGNQYRCVRHAEAARAAGWSAEWRALEDVAAKHLTGVEIAVLWRVQHSRHVENIEYEVRRGGGVIVFDVDDLMFRPELARTSIIDGMRTTNAGAHSTRETFARVQQTMARADMCTTTTDELADQMREWQKAVYVLPNGYDDATLARARHAVRVRATATRDDLIRIGYAAGTLTHQRDFLDALPGLVRVMQARPKVRLVLFRVRDGSDLVLVDEFEELLPYVDRIEWRNRVDLAELPDELARFDINLAPLERGNAFCEAKSELKYFEAALVDVPTVASATGPFIRAIEHGRTGMLAYDAQDWFDSLLRLVDDAGLRHAVGRNAYVDCLWRFGPRRRTERVAAFLEQVKGTAAGAHEFALDLLQARRAAAEPRRLPAMAPSRVLHRRDSLADAEVTVVVPCYNYADYVIDALESVRSQTLGLLDLVVVDDCSTDPLTAELITEWARRHDSRFNRLLVLRHDANCGLSAARNTAFHAAETPFVLPLDADNRLRPECCATLLGALRQPDLAYAYATVEKFGADDGVFCDERYQPMRFVGGNYIDAMAMIAKWAWAAAGGYDMPRGMGWEDFDLWCGLAELGQRGCHVRQTLAEYRVHGGSMVASVVEIEDNKQQTVALAEQRHDWLRLTSRRPRARV